MCLLESDVGVPADQQLPQVQLLRGQLKLVDLANLDDCCYRSQYHDLGCCCCSGDLEVGSSWVLDQDDDGGGCGGGSCDHGLSERADV